jgi:hypothetical protein
MNTIIAILRAAHCKSTHHYFAIDALQTVLSSPGKQLVGMLLAHHGDYLQGAKAPDNVFKDFENHVLHVRDGYWGGAAVTAEKWLEKCLGWLAAGNWKEASYSIGVLSHYFTDPFMPLHTAQSPRETILHRPLEWSVCCSYQSIYEMACRDLQNDSFPIASGHHWLTQTILRGAKLANECYEPLLDDYDLNESARFPKLALGRESQRLLAQIFTWVLAGWGGVVDRIANESRIALPNFTLTIPTLVAGLQIPTKKIVAAIESAEQRKEVERILTEFNHTGKVIQNVSPEQRRVAKIRMDQPELRASSEDVQRSVVNQESEMSQNATNRKLPSAVQPRNDLQPFSSSHEPNRLTSQVVVEKEISNDQPVRESQAPEPKARLPIGSSSESAQRLRLTPGSPIVDAPAIGPKTAARFEAIGMHTVGDLLSRDAEQIAAELAAKWINVRLVSQWQDQARLSCHIERLSAVGSGLLVMSGIRTPEQLACRSATDIMNAIHATAQSTEGQRLLRDHAPPSLKVIQRWIDAAQASKNAA